MQEMLNKIIEMDEKARKIRDDAQENKVLSEKEIEKLKQQIHDDYIERAKSRIEKNIKVDRDLADERWQKFAQSIDEKKAILQSNFDRHRDLWIDEITEEVIG